MSARVSVEVLLFTILYAAATWLGKRFALPPDHISAVWPASGIALGAVLLFGTRIWPGIWLASFVVNLWSFSRPASLGSIPHSMIVAASIGFATALEAVAGAALFRRFAKGGDPLDRAANVLYFVTFAGLVSRLIGATISVTVISLAGCSPWSAYGVKWLTWWLGNTAGVVTVTPLVLVARKQPPQGSLRGVGALLAVLLLVGELVFGGASPIRDAHFSLTHLFVPVLVGSVLWLGELGAVVAILAVSVMATAGTVAGLGPFATADRTGSLILLQAFIFDTSLITLTLAAVLNERRRAERRLAGARDDLEQRVEARTLELRASEERHRTVLELSPDAIFVFCGERIVYANSQAARLFGAASPDDLVGRRILDHVPAAYERSVLERMRAIHEARLPVPLEEQQVVRLDGSLVDVEVSGAPIGPYGGEPAVVAMVRDITARKQLERERDRHYREAKEAIVARDDFLAVASHELKTPLTSLQLQVQLLQRLCQRDGATDARLAPNLSVALRQVQRLETLVDDLLDASRAAPRQLAPGREPIELRGLVEAVMTRFEPEAARAGSALVLASGTRVEGRWNRAEIDRVVTNLLSNALKYGPGKPVEIGLVAADGRAILSVRDGGIGIDPEDHARIFQRFERAVSSRHYGGFGLGLWAVRQIVDALGGTISVESADGHGALFIVEIPLVPASA